MHRESEPRNWRTWKKYLPAVGLKIFLSSWEPCQWVEMLGLCPHPDSDMPNTHWPSASFTTIGLVLKLMPRDFIKTQIVGLYTPRIMIQYFWGQTWEFCISNKFSSVADADGLLDGELPLRTIGLAKKFIWVFPQGVMENANELFGQPDTSLQFIFTYCSCLCLCYAKIFTS